jgi:hypothetical protein
MSTKAAKAVLSRRDAGNLPEPGDRREPVNSGPPVEAGIGGVHAIGDRGLAARTVEGALEALARSVEPKPAPGVEREVEARPVEPAKEAPQVQAQQAKPAPTRTPKAVASGKKGKVADQELELGGRELSRERGRTP